MTKEEREKLIFELETLKWLLDFRIQNSKDTFINQKEFEEYVDAILDRINELKQQLKEPPHHE